MRMRATIFAAMLLMVLCGAAAAETPGQDYTGKPSVQLRNEHALILTVTDAVRKEVSEIRKKDAIDSRRVRRMVDFFTEFVENGHDVKEERFYLPAAVYHNDALLSLVDRLRAEHAYGHSILEELNYALDGDYTPDFIAERLEQYAELIEGHIARENEQLYPKADIMIAGAEERGILIGFRKIEDELGSGFF